MLDEPDSHLHPSKTKEMIEFLQDLVNNMKYQIIITTHHPVTASFVNDVSLFLMYFSKNGKLKLTLFNFEKKFYRCCSYNSK